RAVTLHPYPRGTVILVRDILDIDPNQMKAMKSLVGDMAMLTKKLGFPDRKVMTDLVGTFYTLLLESEWPDLGTYERELGKAFQNAEWQALYGKMRPMVRG